MGIQLSYQPPLQGISDAAIFAGQGSYLAQQQALGQRQQALEQQAAIQQQELAARMYGQQQSIAANQQSQLFQAAQQQAFSNQRREQQLTDVQTERGWRKDDLQQANQWRIEGDQRQQQAMWENKSVGDSEQAIDARLSELDAQRDRIPSQLHRDRLDQILGTYRGVRGNKMLQSNPKAYAEGLGRVAAELDAAGIVVEQPKTLEDEIKSGQVYKEEVRDEEGNLIGHDIYRRTYRGGKQQVDHQFRPYKTPANPLHDFALDPKNIEHYGSAEAAADAYYSVQAKQKEHKERLDAIEGMKAAQARMESGEGSADDYLVASGSFMPPATTPTAPRPTTRTAKNFDEYWGSVKEDEKRQWRKQAFDILKANKDRETAPTAEEIMGTVKELVNATNGYSTEQRDSEASESRFNEWAKHNPALAAQLRAESRGQTPAYPQQNPAPLSPTQTPVSLPPAPAAPQRPRTFEEYWERLPPDAQLGVLAKTRERLSPHRPRTDERAIADLRSQVESAIANPNSQLPFEGLLAANQPAQPVASGGAVPQAPAPQPPAVTSVASQVYPHVNSPAEAEKLPPGTRFVTPDGRIMEVPLR